jgi:heme oxygenase
MTMSSAARSTTVTQPTLPERLRTETLSLHRQIESVIKTPGTIAELRGALARFYGFVAPWEEKIAIGIAPLREALGNRDKTHLLISDLKNLGMSEVEIRALPLCSHLPSVATLSAAMGSMYVLEGSTLGGQLLTRHVESTLGLKDLRGYSYYASYGRDVGVMWRGFKDLLTRLPGESADEVLRSAQRTFGALCDWFGNSERVGLREDQNGEPRP